MSKRACSVRENSRARRGIEWEVGTVGSHRSEGSVGKGQGGHHVGRRGRDPKRKRELETRVAEAQCGENPTVGCPLLR